MNIFSGIILALSLFGFRSSPEPGELIDIKILEYSRILKATNNLTLRGKGGGLKDEKIRLFMADYAVCKDVQIEEARVNIVKLTEFYLHKINNDPNLENLLIETPFPYTNLSIGISYLKADGKRSSELAGSLLQEGWVFYDTFDKETDMLVDVYKETYEEALAIVNGQKNASE